jgi:crotonobetainyl-CoA:carnitine CoA-transferase CaiB-like acyl-CoA transferase
MSIPTVSASRRTLRALRRRRPAEIVSITVVDLGAAAAGPVAGAMLAAGGGFQVLRGRGSESVQSQTQARDGSGKGRVLR